MIGRAIVAVAVALSAGSVRAEFCPGDRLVWPRVCRPEYVSEAGTVVPEVCATLSPNSPDTVWGLTIRNQTTGWEAPVEVVEATATADDTLNALAAGWAQHRYGTAPDGPRHAYDAARILDYQQFNDFVVTAANGSRDTGPGTHQVFTSVKPSGVAKAVARLCPGMPDQARCRAAVATIQNLEMLSVSWGAKYGHSLSFETLSQMFAVLVRAPEPLPAPRCGVVD